MEDLFISANDVASFIYNGNLGKSDKMTLLSELWSNYRSCLEKYLRLDERKFFQYVEDFLTRMDKYDEISAEIERLDQEGYDVDEDDYFVNEDFKDYLQTGNFQSYPNWDVNRENLIISFKHKFFSMLIARPSKFRLSEALNLFNWNKRSNLRDKDDFSDTDKIVFIIYQCLAFYHIRTEQYGVKDKNLFLGKELFVNEPIDLTLV